MEEVLRQRLGHLVPQCGGGWVLDYLQPILRKNGAVMSGGMILQIFLGETWYSSDVDIYVTEENFPKLITDLHRLRQQFSLMQAPMYHNSFMTKNKVKFLANSQIPVVEGDQYSVGLYPLAGENREQNYIDIDAGKIKLQIMCIESGTPLRQVIGSFDLTFCQVLYDGENFETCGETTVEDVLAKRGRLADDYYFMYNHTLNKRIVKYMNRGFTIKVDWKKLGQLTHSKRDVRTPVSYLCSLLLRNIGDRQPLIFYSDNILTYRVEIARRYLEIFVDQHFEFPDQVLKYFPAILDQLDIVPEMRGLFESTLPQLAEQADEHLEALAERQEFVKDREPTESTRYIRTFESILSGHNNPTLRDIGETLNPSPSKDCLLIGSSAIGKLRNIPIKPTYLVKTNRYIYPNHYFIQATGISLESKVWYERYETYNIVFYDEENTELITSFWPVMCGYYDGESYYLNTEVLTETNFTLKHRWVKYLNQSQFAFDEFQNMLKMGYQFIPTDSQGRLERTILYRFIKGIAFLADEGNDYTIDGIPDFRLAEGSLYDDYFYPLLAYPEKKTQTLRQFITEIVAGEFVSDIEDALVKLGYQLDETCLSQLFIDRFHKYYGPGYFEYVLNSGADDLEKMSDPPPYSYGELPHL